MDIQVVTLCSQRRSAATSRIEIDTNSLHGSLTLFVDEAAERADLLLGLTKEEPEQQNQG